MYCDYKFWSVSIKYLQQYLNWYKLKETFKNKRYITKSFAKKQLRVYHLI